MRVDIVGVTVAPGGHVAVIEGLTPEQIEALPRLVKWFTGDPTAEDWADLTELERIFPGRERIEK